VQVVRYAESEVPTEYGTVRVIVYRQDDEEHVALVVGDLAGAEPVLTRVHSECWTGEVLRSRKCDCLAQFDSAMKAIAEEGRGVLVYLRQEGRGIGLGNKIRAYALQASGADTVEANRLLGFGDDERTYDVAAAMLRDLGVNAVELMTNNPQKVAGLERAGIKVEKRRPLAVGIHEENEAYLAVKARKMGHELP
jgi:GTP cyclohydrolase II